MLKSILLAAALVVLPFSASSGTIQHDMTDPVIQIFSTEGNSCSAFSVGDGFYFTAGHCTGLKKTASGVSYVEEYEGFRNPDNPPLRSSSYKWKMVVNVPILDLALIYFEDPEMIKDSVNFCDSDPEIGDQVWSVGFPGYYPKTIVEGLAGSKFFFDGTQILEPNQAKREAQGIEPQWVERNTDALPVYEGMSGGPKYRKVGDDYCAYTVNSVKDLRVPFMSMGPTNEQLREFLKESKKLMANVKKMVEQKKKMAQQQNQLRIQ